MDISEAFRAEDISKTDFFDFVVAPDVTDANALQQFNRSMKSVGIFLESYNNNNNNNNHNNNNNNDNEGIGERHKETNNNNLTTGFVENNFWNSSAIVGTSSCDKETVRWEPSMLEDLNCWNDEQENNSANVAAKSNQHNTDGAIYTLTVLNGSEQTTTWYRPPEDAANQQPQQQQPQTQPQPQAQQPQPQTQPTQQPQPEDNETDQRRPSTSAPPPPPPVAQPTPIDIESFFNNIPATIPCVEQSQNDAFSNGFQRTQNDANAQQASLVEVKQEYFDNKKDLCSNIVSEIVLTPAPAVQYTANNNDWKLQDNNSERCGNNVESLLRNALQGKTFLSRYNGHIKNEKEEEMKRVLINTKTENVFTPELEDEIKTQSPLMAVSLEGGTVVMFDGGSGNGMLIDSDNPSSAQSMDDIFLSQLDSVPYHEDYEKLKRIENEVAESVEQYCNSGQNIYLPVHIGDTLRPVQPALTAHMEHHGLLNSIPTTTTAAITSSSQASKGGGKKYTKRSSTSGGGGGGGGGGVKAHSQLQSAAGGSSSGGGGGGGGGGVRKERSLHYCNICSKGFKDKYSVNVHIRTHTGEKPFACSLCGKSFRQKAHLAKHYHTHLTQTKNSTNGSSSASSSTSSSSKSLNKSR